MRSPGYGKYPQSRCYRRAGLSLEVQDRGRKRRGSAAGRRRGTLRQGTWRHDLLLQRPGSYSQGSEGRMAVYRRYGHAGRGRIHFPGRQKEGRYRQRWRKYLSGTDRKLPQRL